MTFDYSLFDTLLEPLFIIGEDHKVVYCNEPALTLCGLSLRKAQKTKFDDLFTLSEKLEWLDQLQNVTDPTPYKEVRFSTPEGQEGRVQITCREFLPAGPARHWILFVRDVTLEERLQIKYRGELEQKEGYIDELRKAQAELEKYSKNLEKMVEERTQEIQRLNQQMKALLDSLSQGFLIFGADGNCFEVSSKACLSVLEGAPAGRPIWDILKLPANKVEGFKKWMTTVFSEMLPFEDLTPLAPPHYPHSQQKTIALEYFPLRTNEGKIEGVVVMASDITSLVQAQRQAEVEREYAKLIIKLIQSKKEVCRFIRESQQLLSDLKNKLMEAPQKWNREEIYRILHTVKGGSASFSVLRTAETCHQAEQIISEAPGQNLSHVAEALRAKCAEVTLTFQEFLTETKSILGERGLSEERVIEMPVSEMMNLTQKIGFWSKGQDLSYYLLKTYVMESIGTFFEPYKELIQSVATREDKLVEPLIIHNYDLPILSEIYSPLFACLVHAFRNSIDHGIEKSMARKAAGKPEAGRLEVFIELKKMPHDVLQIQIVDDGGGIDPNQIRSRLEKKGISTNGKSDYQIIQHVFDSEFSTKEVVTETSGRGVGMDAIQFAAKKLGGNVRVESILGKGTTLFIEVPYFKEIQSPRPHLQVA